MSFDMDERARKALDDLRDALGASSDAEVLRRALALLQLAARTISYGGQFILRDKNGNEYDVIMGG